MNDIGMKLAIGLSGFLLGTCLLGLIMACIDVWITAYDVVIGWIQ